MYRFAPQRLPGPGVGNYAFEPEYSLPAQSVNGAGIQVLGQLLHNGPPQSYYFQRQGINGLGGIVTGQIILQPLSSEGNGA